MLNRRFIIGLAAAILVFLGAYLFAQNRSEEDILNDKTAPVIKLVGSNPITIEVGSTYTDLGATATDDEDGDITKEIKTSGSVDSSKIGTYTIKYNVEDTAGNDAKEVTREVKVVDTTIPVIKLRGTSPVTIEVGSTYTDEGATATDNYDGTITNLIVRTSNVNTNVVGTYTVIYDVEDSSDNAANEVTRTVNVVDTTAPVISLNGSSTYYVILGLNAYTDEGATVTDNYDAVRTVTGTVIGNQSSVGIYTIVYNATDANGNVAIPVTRTIHVLSPLGDEDMDGYTNEEEYNNHTDYNNPLSHPVDKAPVIKVDPKTVNIVRGEIYNIMTGVTVSDDFDMVTIVPQTIDTSLYAVGTYTITYTSTTDRLGHSATPETRTIIVNRNALDMALDYIEASLDPTTYERGSLMGGLTVTAYDNDGTSYDVTEFATYTTFDTSVVGSKTMTVSYTKNGVTRTDDVSYDVTRNAEDMTLDYIEASLSPTTYERESLMGTLTVTAYDNDGTSTVLTSSDYSITVPFDSDTVGSKTMTVSYTKNGVTRTDDVTYNVTRSSEDMTLDYIEVSLSPTTYERESLIGTLTVTAYDNDGASTVLTSSDYSITVPFDSSTVGSKTMTVSYTKNGVTRTDDVSYTVIKNTEDYIFNHIEASLDPATYERGALMGTLTVTAYDNYGTPTVLSDGDYTITASFDSSTVGSKTMSVSYTQDGITDTAHIIYSVTRNAEDMTLNYIEASLSPTTYLIGDSIGALTVTSYDNDSTSTVLTSSDYSITVPFDSSTAGSRTITVSYTKNGVTRTDDVSYTVNTPDTEGPDVDFNYAWVTIFRSNINYVTITDVSGIDPTTLKYSWTQHDTMPDLNSFQPFSIDSEGNSTNIPTQPNNKHFLWIYAEDSLGNPTIPVAKSEYVF